MSFYVLPIYEDDDNNDSNVSVPNDMHLQLATVEVLCNNTSRLLASSKENKFDLYSTGINGDKMLDSPRIFTQSYERTLKRSFNGSIYLNGGFELCLGD